MCAGWQPIQAPDLVYEKFLAIWTESQLFCTQLFDVLTDLIAQSFNVVIYAL
jgi:hypothetical protein